MFSWAFLNMNWLFKTKYFKVEFYAFLIKRGIFKIIEKSWRNISEQ